MFNDTGSTVYVILLSALAPFSVGGLIFVIWWFTHSDEGDKQNNDLIQAIWNRRDEWGEDICRQLISKQISPQMTPDMVRLAWPEPEKIEPLTPPREKWHYRPMSKQTTAPYIIFENGLVVEIVGNGATTATPEFNMRMVVLLLGFILMMIIGIIFSVIAYYA